MRKRCLFIILILFIPSLFSQLSFIQSFFYKEFEITSSTEYDVNGDGPKEIIVGSRNLVRLTGQQGQTVKHSEGYVTLLDVFGKTVWRYDTDSIDDDRTNDNGRAVLSVAAGDLRGDGTKLIIAGTEKEKETFPALAGYTPYVPPFPAPPPASDFPVDVYTSYVYALRPDGTLFWTSDPIYNDNVKMIFISDLNADGIREVVAVCFYSIYVFDYNGKYFWPNTTTTYLIDGDFESWNTPTDLTNWTEVIAGTSTVNRESTSVCSGTYAVRLSVDAGNSVAQIYQDITLTGNTPYHIMFYSKVSDASGTPTLAYSILNNGNGKWLQPDGTWGPSSNSFVITPSTSWAPTSMTFISDTAGSYKVSFSRWFAAGKNLFIDDATLMASADRLWSSASKIHDIAIEDTDMDGKKEIAVAANRVYLLEDTGLQTWSYPAASDLPSDAMTIFTADVDSNMESASYKDPNPEVIAGVGNFIYAIDEDGSLQWSFETPSPVSDVIVAPFFESKNIIVASDFTITILRNDLTVLATFIAPSRVQDIIASDLNHDGQYELLLSGNNLATIYDRSIAAVWTSRLGDIFIGASLQDLDLDGYAEVIETFNDTLYVYKSQKSLVNEGDRLFFEAESYLNKRDYRNALIFFQRARDKYKEIGDNRGMARSEDMAARCEKYIIAQQLYEQAEKMYSQKEFGDAKAIYEQAEDAFRMVGDVETVTQISAKILACDNYILADSYLAKAEGLFAQKAYKDSEFFANQARDLYVSVNDIEKIQRANALLSKNSKYRQAESYYAEGERKLLRKDYSNALSYFEKAEKIYEELGDMVLLEKTRQAITSLQKTGGQESSFLKQYRQYLILGGAVVAFITFVFLVMLLLILKKQDD